MLGSVERHGPPDTNVPLGGAAKALENRFQPATKARLPSTTDVATSVAVMSIAAPLVTVDALHDHVSLSRSLALSNSGRRVTVGPSWGPSNMVATKEVALLI